MCISPRNEMLRQYFTFCKTSIKSTKTQYRRSQVRYHKTCKICSELRETLVEYNLKFFFSSFFFGQLNLWQLKCVNVFRTCDSFRNVSVKNFWLQRAYRSEYFSSSTRVIYLKKKKRRKNEKLYRSLWRFHLLKIGFRRRWFGQFSIFIALILFDAVLICKLRRNRLKNKIVSSSRSFHS